MQKITIVTDLPQATRQVEAELKAEADVVAVETTNHSPAEESFYKADSVDE